MPRPIPHRSLAHRSFARRPSAVLLLLALFSLIILPCLPALAAATTATTTTIHAVRGGDTLWLIAQRYGVTVADLRSKNGLGTDLIYPGQVLAIPGAQPSPGYTRYTVAPGDTLWLIGMRFGLTVEALAAANGLGGTVIHPGQVLRLPLSLSAARFVHPAGLTLHRVAQGETLYGLARRYGTSIAAISATNQLSSQSLMVNQPLFVSPGTTTPSAVSLAAGPRAPGTVAGELLAWEQARWAFNVGHRATIRDPRSGLRLEVTYMGGSDHADCEPLTPADTATLLAMAGGQWTWTPKPALVAVDGRTIAASINFMPHGVETNLQNGLAGHFCAHFLHSTKHSTNLEDPRHQENVLAAAGLTGVLLPPGL